MVLRLYRSNCMERLADALSRAVERPLRNVLQAEWIAVPSPGMERWLSMELARRFGVWANPAFPFPRALLESLLSASLPVAEDGVDPGSAYEPLRMQFAIASLLESLAARPEFVHVRDYVGPDGQADARRLSLAARIADVFDHYVTYRPDLVLGWQAGAESHWQALLFRALVERSGPGHLAARTAAALERLSRGAPLADAVPERINLFGLSTLPPLYLDLLAGVSEQREVNLFVLSPCREYYADVRSERERIAAERRAVAASSSHAWLPSADDAAQPSEGHPLLSSLGRHSREFQEVLESRSYVEPHADLYDDPGSTCLLHALQSDMLWLRDPSSLAEPRTIEPEDRSIAIHSCHSAMREVEVLHDQLLALISDGSVDAHEIVVMTPDISAYAPVIEAVFSQSQGRQRIPFRIADRGVYATQAVVNVLDALLDLLDSRFAASQVLDVLAHDLVRERFAIAPAELDVLREWVAHSGIRWGVDARHRAEVGQPERAENTWRFGLARLALGYAGGDDLERMFAGRAPAPVDASDADLLGRFMEFCERLFEARQLVAEPCGLATWRERIGRLLAVFVADDARTAGEQRAVRHALAKLDEQAERAGFEAPLALASVRKLLERVLETGAGTPGFLAGGVTFCQLVPMRSIPFQVVALLGLHDGAFPGSEAPFDFDLMAKRRRPGDRRRRDDDRQLFLEALLSARRAFIVTYIGRSIHDGQVRLPSVLVTELLAHIQRGWTTGGTSPAGGGDRGADAIQRRIVSEHALLVVSPRYFGADRDAGLFSFARGSLAGARAICQPRRPARSFFDAPTLLPAPVAALTLSELEECLVRPLRMFARRQLGLQLGRDLDVLDDREPFELDALERWQVASDLLMRRLERPDRARQDELSLVRARGQLPLGMPGVLELRALSDQVGAIASALEPHTARERLAPIELDLQLGPTRLTGSLDQVWPTAQLRAQYSRTGNRHELRHFVRHLALQCVRAQRPELELPDRSVLIGRSDNDDGPCRIEFGPIPDPVALLGEYVAIFAAGQLGPLPLFENASRVYARALAERADEDRALALAQAEFAPEHDAGLGDDNDAYVAQFFRDFEAVLASPEPYAFKSLAQRVYAPLFACRSSS